MTEPKTHDTDVNEGRREALAKMGRYAAYTAPTMLSLLVADTAAAAGSWSRGSSARDNGRQPRRRRRRRRVGWQND